VNRARHEYGARRTTRVHASLRQAIPAAARGTAAGIDTPIESCH